MDKRKTWMGKDWYRMDEWTFGKEEKIAIKRRQEGRDEIKVLLLKSHCVCFTISTACPRDQLSFFPLSAKPSAPTPCHQFLAGTQEKHITWTVKNDGARKSYDDITRKRRFFWQGPNCNWDIYNVYCKSKWISLDSLSSGSMEGQFKTGLKTDHSDRFAMKNRDSIYLTR